MKSIKCLEQLWTFTDERCYILLAIARSKENDNIQATDQPTIRKIIEDRDELENKIEQLKQATSRFDNEYRLYATINGRNARDALHLLQKESLDWLRKSEKSGQTPTKIKRIDHEWKSILQRDECRDEKRFLWDIDDPSEEALKEIRASLSDHRIMTLQTPNGWHIITDPFNFTAIDEFDPDESEFHGYECERKNDSLTFMGFL